jgi:hypothetical protein
MRVVLKRAKYFILCNGKMYEKYKIERENLAIRLQENAPYAQLSLFDTNPEAFIEQRQALPDLQSL